MGSDVERARHRLGLARSTSERLLAEHSEFAKTLDLTRGVASPEEVRRIGEVSASIWEVHTAEHALFSAEHGTPGIVGTHGDYQWLSVAECDISTLLEKCPEVVLGKYLAITSIDSGTLQLTEEERQTGWSTPEDAKVFRGTSWSPPEYRADWKVAFSPRVDSIHGLPNETHDECCAGFDEWNIFREPPPILEMEAFVNWSGPWIYDPQWKWCANRFWDQMDRLAPESYVADGFVFCFATRDAPLFQKVLEAFSATSESPKLEE
jgi:hypothetical protein